MTRTIEFLFDFASPNAYLAERVLPGMARTAAAGVRHLPVLLGGVFKSTGNQPPLVAYAGVPAKLAYEKLEITRFVDRFELREFRWNPHFPVNSLALMRGYVAAEQAGVADAYRAAVFAGLWERGLKMDDPAVAAGVLDEAGLDGAALLARGTDPAVKAALLAATEAAVARGVFGIPTFFVGTEIFFGKERLVQVAEAAAFPNLPQQR